MNEKRSKVYLRFTDLEKLYRDDIYENDNGFIIDTSIDYMTKMADIDTLISSHSIYHHKYDIPEISGTNIDVMKYLYRCDCGESTGHFNYGKECPKCQSLVTKKTHNFDYRGWFTMPKYNGKALKIINPHVMALMVKYMSTVILTSADSLGMNVNKRINDSFRVCNCGHTIITKKKFDKGEDVVCKICNSNVNKMYDPKRTKDLALKHKQKYNIVIEHNGNITFITDNGERVMLYTEITQDINLLKKFISDNMVVNNEKTEYVKLALLQSDNLLTSVIPAISSKARSVRFKQELGVTSVSAEEGINKQLIKISNISNILYKNIQAHHSKNKISALLAKIQTATLNIDDVVLDKLGGSKKSIVRGDLFGRRYTQTSRLILSPSTRIKLDECEIPFDAFRTIFDVDIIKFIESDTDGIMTKYSITPNKLNRLVDTNYLLNDMDREILSFIFSKSTFYTTINREPSIYYSSTLSLKVRHLNKDELVLRISPAVLSCIAGDHDGDILGISPIPIYVNRERVFENMKPQNYILDWKGSYSGIVEIQDVMKITLYEATRIGQSLSKSGVIISKGVS